MDANSATLQLPKDLIEAAVRTEVATAIAASLKGHESVVNAAINRVLMMKVDRDGRPSSYSDSRTFIEWLCNTCIEKAIREVAETEIEKFKPQMKDEMVKMLSKKNSPLLKSLAAAMVDGFAGGIGNKWRTEIKVTHQE